MLDQCESIWKIFHHLGDERECYCGSALLIGIRVENLFVLLSNWHFCCADRYGAVAFGCVCHRRLNALFLDRTMTTRLSSYIFRGASCRLRFFLSHAAHSFARFSKSISFMCRFLISISFFIPSDVVFMLSSWSVCWHRIYVYRFSKAFIHFLADYWLYYNHCALCVRWRFSMPFVFHFVRLLWHTMYNSRVSQ